MQLVNNDLQLIEQGAINLTSAAKMHEKISESLDLTRHLKQKEKTEELTELSAAVWYLLKTVKRARHKIAPVNGLHAESIRENLRDLERKTTRLRGNIKIALERAKGN